MTPTPEQIEAAARALYEHEPHLNASDPIAWLDLNEHVRARYRNHIVPVLKTIDL